MTRQSGGFSLIELLLALIITLLLTMMLFQLFRENERVVRDQTLTMEMQQTARVVASQIADEVRMAGQGVPVFAGQFDTAASEAIAPVLGTSDANRIDIRAGLSNTETAVAAAGPLDLSLGTSRTLSVADGSSFSATLSTSAPAGRFVYVWGRTAASWAWVRAELTSITPASLTITPRQSSNMDTRIHFIASPTISLEEAVSIFLNSGSARRATGVDLRDPANPSWSAANEIGRNVISLSFVYYDSAGNVVTPSSLNNRMQIMRVDIQLTVQVVSALSNGTWPTCSISLRTIPRNVRLRNPA